MMKHILPKSLLGRSILIIVIPLILLQLVSAFVFYENHWSKVSIRLARSVVGDIAAVVDLLGQNNTTEGRVAVLDLAATHFALKARLFENKVLANSEKENTDMNSEELVLLILLKEQVCRFHLLERRTIARLTSSLAFHVRENSAAKLTLNYQLLP